MHEKCAFCRIVCCQEPSSIVCEDELAIAFMDLRQFNPGHTLIIPKKHMNDVRDFDSKTGLALMTMISRVTQAVASLFPNQGLSLWHSIGEAAFQEVPHLHVHVQPRLTGDEMLQVYPRNPDTPERSVLDHYADVLRSQLNLRPDSV